MLWGWVSQKAKWNKTTALTLGRDDKWWQIL